MMSFQKRLFKRCLFVCINWALSIFCKFKFYQDQTYCIWIEHFKTCQHSSWEPRLCPEPSNSSKWPRIQASPSPISAVNPNHKWKQTKRKGMQRESECPSDSFGWSKAKNKPGLPTQDYALLQIRAGFAFQKQLAPISSKCAWFTVSSEWRIKNGYRYSKGFAEFHGPCICP